jgi:hypothetical protein
METLTFAAAAVASGALAILAAAAAAPRATASSPGLADLTVAAGCDRPTAVMRGRTFYVDPARGSDSGDGSAARPWATLAQVIQRHQQEFRAGDQIVLASGEHGGAMISQKNNGFVVITAAPGAKAHVDGLMITGSHWIVQGLDVQQPRPGKLVTIGRGAQNIIFDRNHIASQDDVQDWTPTDWSNKAAGAINVDGRGGTRCITISNNEIRNVTNPITLFAPDVLFLGNRIDHFGGDGIDYSGDNLVIAHNVLTNAMAIGNDQHIDGMQGFTPGGTGFVRHPYDHVTIDGNVVIRQTDPSLAAPVYMQGIDAWDDDWTNLTVTNNVVVTNTYTGIFFASVHHGLIANNTVVSDEHRTVNAPPGAAKPTIATGELVWINVGDRTHEGSSSNDVVLRNNIAQTIMISTQPGAVEADHNVVYHQWLLRPPYVARSVNQASAGPIGNHNRIDPSVTKGFVRFDPKAYAFDLRLRAGSPAIGAGNPDRAPGADADGKRRNSQTDLGAYAYPKS